MEGEQGLAAVDLGSNSFHLVVAVEREGELVLLDRIRERVGLAEGLSADGQLDEVVRKRALDCLKRFEERLRGLPAHRVRAVGTATFRDVRDNRKFLTRAEKSLGFEIETLPGEEEARLIYLGVAHSLGDDSKGRLVIDIGGGSTEIVLGSHFESKTEVSLPLGCINQSKRYFEKGALTEKAFRKAILGARVEIATVAKTFHKQPWEQCVGASGTIIAVAEILAQNYDGDGTVTAQGLDLIIRELCEVGHVEHLRIKGLKEDRRGVVAGGLSILRALFHELPITEMSTAKGALREGLLYDLLGRLHHEDVRHRSVTALAGRFTSEEAHTGEVRATAKVLWHQVRKSWGLRRSHKRLLYWAVDLAEVGMAVSFSGYHHHGAYMVTHSDLPGFSSERRNVLADLVRNHRNRARADAFEGQEESEALCLRRVGALLRIAHRLNRARSATPQPEVQAKAEDASLHLEFPKGWLAEHPLAQEDLEQESQQLTTWGIELSFV